MGRHAAPDGRAGSGEPGSPGAESPREHLAEREAQARATFGRPADDEAQVAAPRPAEPVSATPPTPRPAVAEPVRRATAAFQPPAATVAVTETPPVSATAPVPSRPVAAPAGPVLVDVRGISRTYGSGSSAVHALRNVSFAVASGELVAVKGRSGSGKTTMLNCVGGLDTPQEGTVVIGGTNVTELDEEGLLHLRRSTIGFVFQSFGLVPILSASENVGLPMRLLRADPKEREAHVRGLLDLVGLGDHAAQRPYELSGGQQQRVAIARALANSPQLLIADEPTGQLDSSTAMDVMELIRDIVRQQGVTAIVATHDPVLLDFADRVLELHDGELVS